MLIALMSSISMCVILICWSVLLLIKNKQRQRELKALKEQKERVFECLEQEREEYKRRHEALRQRLKQIEARSNKQRTIEEVVHDTLQIIIQAQKRKMKGSEGK